MSAADDLDTITERWSALAEAAGTRPVTGWPPIMGVARILDDEEREQYAAERADSAPDAPGPRPTPVDVDVLDVMNTIEQGLCTTADWLASRVQRPVMTVPTGRGWSDEAHRQAVLAAAKDAADPRRWKYQGERSALSAASWLAHRLAERPGPFRALDGGERDAVAKVAAMGAELLRKTLGEERRTEPVPHPCPGCRGQLVVAGGDGLPPVVRCEDCGRSWRERGNDVA
ncbi:hypothetical protein ACNYS0_21090 [Streptomyces sp. BH034]|uniref:hypothetical protein n=1 Tax=Streptomyces sp. BH034 TaxID=3402626 RepID=UPI003BB6FE31